MAEFDLELRTTVAMEAIMLERDIAWKRHNRERNDESGKRHHDLNVMLGVVDYLLGNNDELGIEELVTKGKQRLVEARELVGDYPTLLSVIEPVIIPSTDKSDDSDHSIETDQTLDTSLDSIPF